MSIFDLLKNTYNTLDKNVFKGTLPLGSAAKIKGNTAILNGEPHTFNGKKWVPDEEYIKSNASKIGSKQAQAVQEVLTKVVSNPIVNTGLQIGSEVLELTGGPIFQRTITGQTPMEMIGKASNLAITQPLSDLTNVDPLWVDTALALTPFGKAGLSKLGRLRIPGTATKTFLPRNPLRIGVKPQRTRSPRNPNYGTNTRHVIAKQPKTLETLVGHITDLAEGVMPQSLQGLRFGPSINKAVNTIPAVLASGKVPGGSITDHRMSKLITPEGVTAIYGTKKLGKRVLGSDAHGGMSKPVFHHIIGKKIRYRFQQKMQQFDPQGGKGRLEALDKKYNLEAGSGDNAGLSMDTGAHGAHHDTSRVAGIEPWDTKAGKTLSKLKGLIDNAKTIEELEYLYDLYLKHSVIPDLDKAIKYQRGYEILGSPTVVDKNLLSKTADEWGTRMKDINEVRATEAQRQMGEYDAVADELKQLNSNRYNAF